VGDRLVIAPDQENGELDLKRVFYFDLATN
jgi:hypothetical protein